VAPARLASRRAAVALLVAAAFLVGLPTVAAGRTRAHVDVVNGTTAAPTWSSIAALVTRRPSGDQQFCGGSLIAPSWVLTAAHCAVAAQRNPAQLHVLVGRQDLLAGGGDDRTVVSTVIHPDYTDVGSADLALLRLDRPSTQTPVPLVSAAAEPRWDGTTTAQVAGWGSTIARGGGYPTTLLSATIPVYEDGFCSAFFGSDYVSARHLCAGSPTTGACDGDSGGPLVAVDTTGRNVLVGAVSYGAERQCVDAPAVYSRIAYFRPWIDGVAGTAATTTTTTTTTVPAATAPGYAVLGADGRIAAFGSRPSPTTASVCGGKGNACVDIAAAGGGLWVSRGSCELTALGGARTFASPRTDEACHLAAKADGTGLWALTTSGHVLTVGSARSFGEVTRRVNGTWLHLEPRPQGDGYWLVGSDGGIFTFGAAKFFGSTGNRRLNQPIVSMAATPSGNGYWLVARDGGVFTFGDARFYGTTAGAAKPPAVVGIQPTSTGRGYWLFARDGGVHAFGDAKALGSATGRGPIVAAVTRT
jgi:hypothetical protein